MTITAKFASVCPCCGARIVPGTKVEWSKGSPAKHVGCVGKPVTATVSRPAAYRPRASGAGAAPSVRGYSSYCTNRPGCGCFDCE